MDRGLRADRARTGWRTRQTYLAYCCLAVLGFAVNGLGATLLPLQLELGVSRSTVAAFPTFFAAALVVLGLSGAALTRRVGRGPMLVTALLLVIIGAVLYGLPHVLACGAGAAAVGAGCAIIIQSVPATLGQAHPERSDQANTEANALGSTAGLLAPVAVGTGLATGLGWRVGYLGPALLGALALLPLAVRLRGGSAHVLDRDSRIDVPGRRPARPLLAMARPWTGIVLAVSAEFCMVLWSADAMHDWHGATPSDAVLGTTAYLLGMAVMRVLGTPALHRVAAGRLFLAALLVAAAGWTLFWTLPYRASGLTGLVVTGIGISLLYPLLIGRLVRTRLDDPDAAAAAGALASGLAIGGCPLLLARLSELVGLRAAYLVVPAALALLTVLEVTRGRASVRTARTDEEAQSLPNRSLV